MAAAVVLDVGAGSLVRPWSENLGMSTWEGALEHMGRWHSEPGGQHAESPGEEIGVA